MKATRVLVQTTLICLLWQTPGLAQCVGDCNGNAVVAISELITGVNITLGRTGVEQCAAVDANDDGRVTISELIRAVNNALSGCPPTPSPTSTATPLPATVTPIPPTDTPVPTATASSTPTATEIPLVELAPVGNRAIPLGQSLSFQLSLVTPTGRPVTFSVSPLPLPANAQLNSRSGLFSFAPTEAQVGDYELIFGATDTMSADAETITISVLPPAMGSSTAVSGRLLDTNSAATGQQVPVVGATVSLIGTAATATSDAMGLFTIENAPGGIQILDIATSGAAPAPDGSSYAGFREAIELIESVDNVIRRPIYLPRIDAASLTRVIPDATTMVKNPNLGVMVEIPPGTAKAEDGTNFDGMISISEVPMNLAPAALPAELNPEMLITIQPVGVTFLNPVPITFPNNENLPVGSEVDIWSLSPETGEFGIVGVGMVVALPDGSTVIETIEGGIRAADWHFILSPLLDLFNDLTNFLRELGQSPCSAVTGSSTTIGCGNLAITHALPAHRSLDQQRAVQLAYNSYRADPQIVIQTQTTIERRSAVPQSISTIATVGGVEQDLDVFTNTSDLSESVDVDLRQATLFDARPLATGVYDYSLSVTSHYRASSVSSTINGPLLVDNRSEAPEGSGWGVAGVQRLREGVNGTALISDGSGESLLFRARPFDLREWTSEGFPADWRPSDDGRSVVQLENGEPSFFVSPEIFDRAVIRGTFRINTGTDDDFVGFALGYSAPLSEAGDTPNDFDLVLFDWKQGNQTEGGFTGFEGFSLSRIRGNVPDERRMEAFWGHQPSELLEFLATDYSTAKGWRDRTAYRFEVVYSPTRIVVRIDEETIFDVAGTFPAGRFAFYNYSQPNVTYGDVTAEFTGVSSTTFLSPPGDYSVLRRNVDGTFTRSLKNGTRFHFDSTGLQQSIVDRNGNETTFEYDDQDRLTRIVYPTSATTTFAYTGQHLSSTTDPAGRVTLFEHDSAGDLRAIVDPDGSRREFDYDDRHRMVAQRSKRGFETRYFYNFAGRHVRSELPDGSTREVTPLETMGLEALAAGMGTEANPLPVMRPDDAVGSFRDGNGHESLIRTDRFGSATTVTDPIGRTTTTTRNDEGLAEEITRPGGDVTEIAYDPLGNPTLITEAAGTTLARQTQLVYDPDFSQVVAITDPLNRVTTLEYDDSGNLEKITDAEDGLRTFTYTGVGSVETATDENGNPTSFTYDAKGNLETITDAENNTTRLIRDDSGNVIELIEGVASADERSTLFRYDDLSRLIEVEDALGAKTIFRRDENGNVTETELPTGEIVRRTYDTLDRLIQIDDPVRGTSTFAYDDAGNVLSVTDALDHTTRFAYDDANQLMEAIDALDGRERFTYDDNGNLETYTDALDHPTTFFYDVLDRLVRRRNPLNQDIVFEYDAVDDLRLQTKPSGETIAFDYDDLSRLSSITISGDTLRFTYDSVGNLQTATDADSQLAFSYDKVNRLLNQQTLEDGSQPALTLTSGYDAVGNRTALVGSEGSNWAFDHDVVGRLSEIETPLMDTIVQEYDPTGRLTRIGYPNGTDSTLTYTGDGRLDTITHARGATAIELLEYSHNAVGNVAEIKANAGTRTFGYDDLHRLIAAGLPGSPESYTYDALGNRVTSHLSSTHVHDAANRLREDDTFEYEYDADGNQTVKRRKSDDTETLYTYDDLDRLVQIDLPDGSTATYGYDALGRRTEKAVAGQTTRYIYDGDDLLLEYDGAGTQVARYSHAAGIDEPRSMERGGQTFFYNSDHLGSVVSLTNSSGQIAANYSYGAYGNIESPPTAPINPFAFTAREVDPESGLHFYRARYYGPTTGRFLAEDPVGFLASDPNLYRYVFNNPTNLKDPSGELVPVAVILAGAVIGGTVNVGISVLANVASGEKLTTGIGGAFLGGAIAGGIGSLSGPLGGTIAKGVFGSATKANGAFGIGVSTVISGVGGALGQSLQNAVNGTDNSIAASGGFAGVGGLAASLSVPSKGLFTLLQASFFAPKSLVSALMSPNVFRPALVSAGLGSAPTLGEIFERFFDPCSELGSGG